MNTLERPLDVFQDGFLDDLVPRAPPKIFVSLVRGNGEDITKLGFTLSLAELLGRRLTSGGGDDEAT